MVLLDSQVASALRDWVPFFSVTAATAATLIGLIFVAVSINVRVMNQDQTAHLQLLARRTLGSFIFVMLVSLVCLIPRVSPESLATSIGITAVVYTGRVVVGMVRRGRRAVDRAGVVGLIGYLLSVVTAVGLWRDDPRWLNLMPVILLTVLAVAAFNSWALLLQIGRAESA